MSNFSSSDMAIYAAADMAKALQKPFPESPFHVGESQIKYIRGLAKTFDAEIQLPNRDALPTPTPYPLIKQSSKIPKVKYQTAPPPTMVTYEEYKKRYQKHPNPNQETPLSVATRVKYSKKPK